MRSLTYIFIVLWIFSGCVLTQHDRETILRKEKSSLFEQLMYDNLLISIWYNLPKANEKIKKRGIIKTNGVYLVDTIISDMTQYYGEYANIICDSVYGFVNLKGEITLFPQFEEVYWYYGSTGCARINEEWALVSRKGKLLTEFKYDKISFSHQNIYKAKRDNKYSLINERGETVLDTAIELDYMVLHDGLIPFVRKSKEDKLKGLVDLKGNVVIEAEYEEIYGRVSEGLLKVKKKGKWGFITVKGKEQIPLIYDDVGFGVLNGLISVKEGEHWGIVNTLNELVIRPKYDKIDLMENDLIRVKEDSLMGFLDVEGRVVVPCELKYSYKSIYREGLAVFEDENGNFGYMNEKGEVAISSLFQNASAFQGGSAIVVLNDYYGLIDKSGTFIMKNEFKHLERLSDTHLEYTK